MTTTHPSANDSGLNLDHLEARTQNMDLVIARLEQIVGGCDNASERAEEALICVRAALANQPAQTAHALEGRMVSVDVSTCDDDALHRIFAELTGETASDRETLIAVEQSRNFDAHQPAQEQAEPDWSGVSTRGTFLGRDGAPANWQLKGPLDNGPVLYLGAHGYVELNGKFSAELTAERCAVMHRAGQQEPVAAPKPPFPISDDEMAALRRFWECATDDEGYDVSKRMMQRLADMGLVQRKSGAYYMSTDFGLYVLGEYTVDRAAQLDGGQGEGQ